MTEGDKRSEVQTAEPVAWRWCERPHDIWRVTDIKPFPKTGRRIEPLYAAVAQNQKTRCENCNLLARCDDPLCPNGVAQAQTGCGDPSCKDPKCTYGEGPTDAQIEIGARAIAAHLTAADGGQSFDEMPEWSRQEACETARVCLEAALSVPSAQCECPVGMHSMGCKNR